MFNFSKYKLIDRSVKRNLLIYALIAFLATNISITMATSEVSKVASGNVQFASKFYEILSKEKPGENIFFSPLSAHTVLSLVYQGAAGTTAQKLSLGLNVPDKLSTAKGYNGVIDTLNHVENVTLHVANKIFVKDNFPLKAAFRQAASDLFLSEAQSVNFGESEKSAGIINQWVEDKTNSKIKDLIKPDYLNALTRLVLVNAVYFKGNWADKFDKDDTKTEPFYVTKDQKVDCQMMHITKKYNYREDEKLNAKVIEIPYDNRDVSMVVILPNAVDGIEDLEKNLVNFDLAKLTEGMYKSEVELSLPKFKMETDMDLESILSAMGMGEIFDQNKADFSEISDSPEQLYVSKAVQKAFIEVNEEGAEAAAATGMIMMARCMPIALPRVQFVADHPFIIALTLRQSEDEHILFLGKVNNVN